MKLKYIPNVLSVIRILLVFVFVFVFFYNYPENVLWALGVFVLAGITDVVDGFLARHFNWITNLGKVLDPLADKLMQCTVLICLYIKSLIPLWLAALYILKEILMGVGGLLVFRKKDIIGVSNVFGKTAVCIFYAAIFSLVYFKEPISRVPYLRDAICAFMLICAIFAICMYYREYLKKNVKTEKEKSN